MAGRDTGQPITWQQVAAWFLEAWPCEPQYPAREHCVTIAIHFDIIRRSGLRATKQASPLGNGEAAAKAFLRIVPFARIEIDARNWGETDDCIAACPGLPLPALLGARKKLDDAERALKALLAACEPMPWNDPAQFVEQAVREAWASVANSKPQLGRYADSPLILFLSQGFAAAKHGMSGETISDRLRGRTGGGATGKRERSKDKHLGADQGKMHP